MKHKAIILALTLVALSAILYTVINAPPEPSHRSDSSVILKTPLKESGTKHQFRIPAYEQIILGAHEAFGFRRKTGAYPEPWVRKIRLFSHPIIIRLYRAGKEIGRLSYDGNGALADDFKEKENTSSPDEKEIISLSLFHSPTVIPNARVMSAYFTDAYHGALITCGNGWQTFSAFDTVRTDRSSRDLTLRALKQLGCVADDLKSDKAHLNRYITEHFVRRGASADIESYKGGKPLISIDQITSDHLRGMIKGMTGWIKQNSDPDGKIAYKYWPSSDRFSSAKNMIRLWMTTQALAVTSRTLKDRDLAILRRQHADHMIRTYYHGARGFGFFRWQKKAKLGANAVAALALAEPDQLGDEIYQAAIYQNLIKGLFRQKRESGKFDTFFMPPRRDDNHAFYPGEALLALAKMMRDPRAQTLLEKPLAYQADLKPVVDYYQNWWHKNGRTLAFVPWHTIAYYHLYQISGDEELIEHIFTMNDALLKCQHKSCPQRPELTGRFYIAACRRHGVPHASSTAVYIEGMAYAYHFAVKKNDRDRATRYHKAIIRGLRSLSQLYIEPEHAWYYPAPEKASGGMRTSIDRNEIRIDNLQHMMMAIDAVRRFDLLNHRHISDPVPDKRSIIPHRESQL